MTVRTGTLNGDVVTDRAGFRRTTRVRTTVELIRRGPLDDGVVLLDRLVNEGIVQLDLVRDAVKALPRCRGSRLAREIAVLADGWAQAPPETGLRLLLLPAELPAPVAQHRVFDADGFIDMHEPAELVGRIRRARAR